ncbi:MAG: hypothetical protein JW955_10525 [Sedimentisphaerales bacterium]|nr:hypothetical protein [Sedimentisphaerales bacterium]
MRKFGIALAVLGTLLVLYLGYARIGGTPPPALRTPDAPLLPDVDAAAGENTQGGTIGGTEIVSIEQTRFFHRDQNGRIDREFGFEVVLHKQGDRWRFTNPYMKLFLPNVQCHVTADTGDVQVQTAFGQVIPNDAVFQGNVVIHIIPPERDDPRECFIYLDDVTFVAERSLFSSTGPVRFVSRSAVLDGVGMELIYDGMLNRLDLFRVIDLKSLRMRSAGIALFSDREGNARRERRAPDAPTASPAPGRTIAASSPESPRAIPVIYECVLRRNVKIDTPERIVIARELLAITDIPWMRSGPAAGRTPAEASEPNAAALPAPPVAEALDTQVSRQIVFDAMSAESFDIVVTCSGGLVVAPTGTASQHEDPNIVATLPAGEWPSLDAAANRQQAIAKRVVYNATTGDAALAGPVQMATPLDPNSLAGPGQLQASADHASEPIPLTITAHDGVRYISAMKRVELEGDCVASAERTEPGLTQSFSLSAPKFALDLAEDANAPASAKAAGKAVALKQFSTSGGQASIVVRKKAGEQLLGWTHLRASQMEYETAHKLFTARGAGELDVNNALGSSLDSNVGERRTNRLASGGARGERKQADPNAFGFDQPCYAFLRDFDLLTFASDTNRIVVSAESQPILIDYIPVIEGKLGRHIQGDAGHLDLTLRRTEAGRMEIASLEASRGITYEDQTKRFIGSRLTYDRERSLVRITGDQTQPCYFNNALVDQIEMDVNTGAFKTRPRGPSTIQGKR